MLYVDGSMRLGGTAYTSAQVRDALNQVGQLTAKVRALESQVADHAARHPTPVVLYEHEYDGKQFVCYAGSVRVREVTFFYDLQKHPPPTPTATPQ